MLPNIVLMLGGYQTLVQNQLSSQPVISQSIGHISPQVDTQNFDIQFIKIGFF